MISDKSEATNSLKIALNTMVENQLMEDIIIDN